MTEVPVIFYRNRNQSTELPCKWIDWVLYNRDLRHERIVDLHPSYYESLFLHIVKQKSFFFFFFFAIFFYLGFLSWIFTIHRTAAKRGGYFFNSSLALPTASHTLRHYPGYCCIELTSAHSWQLDWDREPLLS